MTDAPAGGAPVAADPPGDRPVAGEQTAEDHAIERRTIADRAAGDRAADDQVDATLVRPSVGVGPRGEVSADPGPAEASGGVRRGPDGTWLPPWGTSPSGPAPAEQVDVDAGTGFVDSFVATRDRVLRKPSWPTASGLAAAGLVVGAMATQTVAGVLAGAVLGPLIGLALGRGVVVPWFRARTRTQWTFTASGLVAHRTPPGADSPSAPTTRTWADVEALVVDGRRMLLVLAGTGSEPVRTQGIPAADLAAVLGWAAAAGVPVHDRRRR